MARSLRQRLQTRLEGLKQTRQPYEAEWREIASYAQPARSRWLNTDTNKNTRQRNRALNSGHGILAFRTLQGGMTSGLSSPSRPWFTLSTYNGEQVEDFEVKAWLGEVERRLYAFLGQTNFYGAVKAGYLELGLFGTEACVMVEHPSEGAVCHQLTAGEYWIGLGSALTPTALYRRCPMTALQAVQRFDKDKLRPQIIRAYDSGDREQVFNFFHAIEENDEQEAGYADWRGKPFRSVYWDEGDSRDGVLETKGYEEQPFWAPRWDAVGADSWGVGPGHDALPDLRELQLQTKRKAEATDFHVWPEMVSPAKLKLRRQPKSVVSAPALDIEKVSVPYQVPWQAIGAIREDVMECKDAVNAASYADLFMAITNMQGIQPRNVEEIASRNEEKLTQLGPVIERVNNEKLEIALERAFGIMSRAGLLPPPPESIQDGDELKIEFVSILTQMQRMVGLGQIERAAGFIASQMATFPELRHKIDPFEMADEYGERAGMPAKILRPTKDAQERLQEEAEAAAAEKNAEMVGKMAPAGQVAVEAAALAADPALQGFAPTTVPL